MAKATKTRKTAAKKSPAQTTTNRKAAPKKAAPKKAAPKKASTVARRADFGRPIDGFLAKQPAPLRAILEELRALVEEAAPDATASIKWGMPFYELDGHMMTALGAHRSHVNLILAGPPGTYSDPGHRLEGDGRTGKHLKLRSLDELPRDAVRGWLRSAVNLARAKAGN